MERLGDGGAGIVVEIQAAVLAQQGLAASATAFARELASRTGCARVSIGWLVGGSARIVALSHAVDFDPRRSALEKLGAAMDEAIEQAVTLVLPAEDSQSFVTIAHAEALGLVGNAICTVPLVAEGRVLGAATLERRDAAFGRDEVRFLEDAACLVAPVLDLKRNAERSVWRHGIEALREWPARLARSGRASTRFAIAGVAAAVLCALFFPIPYHVGAPARLEGSVQRVVVAPIDGFLEQVNVRPGDAVRSGQIVAELTLRDLEVERAKRLSELAQHENVYRAALARADRTQFVIHQARAAEAEAQLALLENQIERARIRAPIDGLVIKGDLAQSLGSPVQRGEVLLTLAPDDRYRLIVEVDERDIANVQPHQKGSLALAAIPGEVLEFSVTRVLPVAVAAEGRNFFEVEATLAPRGTLRPGLRGVAKIAVGKRSSAWIVTHRALEGLRLALWSLGT